jgi:hypothetical protein
MPCYAIQLVDGGFPASTRCTVVLASAAFTSSANDNRPQSGDREKYAPPFRL